MRRLGGFPTSPATKEPIIDNYRTVRNIREQMAGSYGEAVAGSLGMLGLYVISSWSMVFNVVVSDGDCWHSMLRLSTGLYLDLSVSPWPEPVQNGTSRAMLKPKPEALGNPRPFEAVPQLHLRSNANMLLTRWKTKHPSS